LGLPIKHEKTVLPTTIAELQGIQFDTAKMIMSIPEDKLARAKKLIDQILGAKKVTLRTIQSIAGLLNFFTKVIKCGRVFIRRLYDLTRGPAIPTRQIRVTFQARSDLRVWKCLLENFNGTCIISSINWDTPNWKIFSDASGEAYGVVLGDMWLQGEFPEEWKRKSIAIQELVPVYLAMIVWQKWFS
ncbi:MAG: hypothetical protein GY705_04535, partial [Bacteroidetes bacterium]|nr:hypothetical protein [Bacteroidota bacterium]